MNHARGLILNHPLEKLMVDSELEILYVKLTIGEGYYGAEKI